VIVFKEGNQPFEPESIATKFTQLYLVVQPDVHSKPGETRYRMVLARKAGVPSYTPTFPDCDVFQKNDYLLDFVLSKLIRGERAAILSPAFQARLQRSRHALLQNLNERFTSQ
jgi:Rap/ran-GAP